MANETAAAVQDGVLVVPVAQEQVQLGVRRVDTGRGVRIHKRVSERTEQVAQSLQHDVLAVRRVPVDRLLAPGEAPAARQEGDTLIERFAEPPHPQ